MSRYPFLLYRQGAIPCVRSAGIAACSPASGLLRRPYPLACRSPLAGDVPATRQGSSFALSGMFHCIGAAVRMSRYPFLLYRQGPVPCVRPAGIAACSPASGLLRRPYPLACRSPLAGDVPATRQGSSFALSGMFHCIGAAVRMSRYPFLLYRQGPVPCVRPAGIAACSPASGLLRRLYPLACRSPLAGDVPSTRQGSSFALSGMFYCIRAAVRMSRYPLLLYRQGPVPCVRPAGIAACSPASGLLRRPYPLACRSPLAGDVPATRQGSSFALSGMFHCIRAAVRMSRYPLLLYRQGPVPCVRPAGIAACSPASGLLRRPYPLACRSPLAGDVPSTRQGSSFALSGMFHCIRAAVRMSRDPLLLYRQGPVPCVRPAGIAACSPASGLLRRPYPLACRSPLAGDVPSTRQGSSFALSGMFYCIRAAVRMSRYPLLLYRQGSIPCVRSAGIAACSPASGLLRRP
jgi:hypothetical protein